MKRKAINHGEQELDNGAQNSEVRNRKITFQVLIFEVCSQSLVVLVSCTSHSSVIQDPSL